MYGIETVENAFLNTIQKSSMAAYLKTLKSYQGDLEEAIKQIIIKFPACLIVYAGSRYDKGAHPVHLYDQGMDFSVFVADGNLKGEEKRRKGSARNPGTYKMLDDLRSTLCGKNLGIDDIDPVEIVSETSVLQSKRLSVYEVLYRAKMEYQSTP